MTIVDHPHSHCHVPKFHFEFDTDALVTLDISPTSYYVCKMSKYSYFFHFTHKIESCLQGMAHRSIKTCNKRHYL